MLKNESLEINKRKLFTVRDFCEHHSWISPGGLRWQIFNSSTNGLLKSGAILRIGRKILIDETRYLDWVYSQNSDGQ